MKAATLKVAPPQREMFAHILFRERESIDALSLVFVNPRTEGSAVTGMGPLTFPLPLPRCVRRALINLQGRRKLRARGEDAGERSRGEDAE